MAGGTKQPQHLGEDLARQVIDTALDAFVAMDHAGLIVEWNKQAGVMFGWSRSEVLGRRLAEVIIPPQHREAHARGLARYLAAGEGRMLGRRIEVSALHRSGREFPAELEITPIGESSEPMFASFIRDITARVEMERQVLEREGWLHRAQMMARMAHVVTRHDGSFEGWSQTVPALIGRPASEVPRTTREWMALIHPDDRAQFREAALEASRTARRREVEYRLQRGDGCIIDVRQWMEPMEDGPAPAGRRWISTMQDITEQKRIEDEIRSLNASLEQRVAERTAEIEAANKELEAFDYSVSHDLQGPIQRIRGFSQALLEDYAPLLDAPGRDYLSRIIRTSERMGELVGDILRLSLATRQELRHTQIDLCVLAGAVFDALRRSQPDRRVEFVCQPGMTLRADYGMMRAVLENLLGNAWKFTAERADARIELTGTMEGGVAVFNLRDNGVGFNQEQAEELFRPFRRLHDAQRFEGSGIGLTTVRRIIQRHGGRIWAEGQEGVGAAIHFTVSPARPP